MQIKDFQTRYQYNTKTDVLGRGGFAIVYKAYDTLLDRTVALKFFTNSGNDKHTLIKEISRVISFEHPNLCRYYDASLLESKNLHGETDETEVGVMEFLDGGDLKSYCKAYPGQQLKLLTDVLRGMSFLHKKGIIHRDLKPQNILIRNMDTGPVAKITDFGISKDMASGDTGSSLLMGTIEYMAPEQFNPEKYGYKGKIGTNLDLWSYGLMVYELITDDNLFGSRGQNNSAEQVMGNILNDELLEEKIARLPEPYLYVVKKCLVKDAKQRVQDPGELIEHLSGSTTGVFTPLPPVPDAAATMVIPAWSRETMVIPQKKTATAKPTPPKRQKRTAILLGSMAGALVILSFIVLSVNRSAKAGTNKTSSDSATATVTAKPKDSAERPVLKDHRPSTHSPGSVPGTTPGSSPGTISNSSPVTTPPKTRSPVQQPTPSGGKTYQETGSYHEGMAAVEDGEKWGYIDQSGKEVIPVIYDDASPFSEDLAAVTRAGKVGFIDKTGKTVIPFNYTASGPFSGGLAIVRRDGKKGYIDKSGKEVIPLIYDDASPFTEGLANVKKDGKFGFINQTGATVIPLIYDYAMPFSKGRAMVKKDGQFSYIDKNGNAVTDVK